MSTELLDVAAENLGPELLAEVVFVGAATMPLWITDEVAPAPRPTIDVDVVVEITTRSAYASFEQRLRRAGFRDDGRVICRWHHRDSALVLDAMPSDARILGFDNRWQNAAAAHPATVALPAGSSIRCAAPPYLLATKLEAFLDRGRNDVFGSKDFQDVIALIDGRPELHDEIAASSRELRQYIALEAQRLLSQPRIAEGIEGALGYGPASRERATLVVEPRLRDLAELALSGGAATD